MWISSNESWKSAVKSHLNFKSITAMHKQKKSVSKSRYLWTRVYAVLEKCTLVYILNLFCIKQNIVVKPLRSLVFIYFIKFTVSHWSTTCWTSCGGGKAKLVMTVDSAPLWLNTATIHPKETVENSGALGQECLLVSKTLNFTSQPPTRPKSCCLFL